MNLLFVVSTLAVADGGPPRVIAEVGNRLISRGHKIRVLARPAKEPRVHLQEGIEVVSSRFRVSNPWSVKAAAREMSEHIAWADCVFVSGVWGPLEGLVLRFADWGKTPVHIRTCGMLEDYILRRNPWKKWLARRVFTDQNIRKAASLIVNTKIEGEHVTRLGFLTPLTVIPNGVQPPDADRRMSREAAIKMLRVAIQPQDRVLLYLGRIHPKKGLHVLLEALSSLMAGNLSWQLLIAGEMFEGEGYKARIERAIDETGFAYKIHFVGEVAGQAKDACFSLGDVFVLPSESEGFSNAVLEAMSWSMPVVITNGCNFPEVADGGAGWIVEQTPKALRAALADASLVFSDLPAKGRKGRQMVMDRFLVENVVEAYERLAIDSRLDQSKDR